MGLLEPVPKTLSSNQFVPEMTDRYEKLTKAVLTSKKSDLHIVSLIMDDLVITYRNHYYFLRDNRTQFISKIFEVLFAS